MKKQKLLTYSILLLIILIGLALRLKHWPDYLTFDFEKARDLIASMKIYTDKKLTLIGPVSEVEGIFHGPLYYYLVGFFYYIFKGDPRVGSIVSFFFNLSSIYILFHIGKNLFNTKVGLISAFIYAVSFEAISYAYWLSNPGPSVPFLFLMFYFFYKFCTKKENYLIASLFCLATAAQFQILNIFFVLPLVVLYFVLGKPKVRIKNLLFSLIAFFLPLASFILFDYRHKFLMLNAFVNNYFVSKGNSFPFNFNLFNYVERFITEFSNIFLPTNKTLSQILLFIVIIAIITKIISDKKNNTWKFLIVWIFSTIPIFLINSRMSQSSAAFIGTSGSLIIIFSYLVDKISSNKKGFMVFFFLIPIFLSNLFAIDHFLTDPGKRLFDFHQGLFLKTDIDIIKYTYKEANGADFTVDTLTSPLYISPLWDYLYGWYARKNSLKIPSRDLNTKIQFFIIEPIFINDVSGSETFKRNFVRIKKQDIADMKNKLFFDQIEVQEWILKAR